MAWWAPRSCYRVLLVTLLRADNTLSADLKRRAPRNRHGALAVTLLITDTALCADLARCAPRSCHGALVDTLLITDTTFCADVVRWAPRNFPRQRHRAAGRIVANRWAAICDFQPPAILFFRIDYVCLWERAMRVDRRGELNILLKNSRYLHRIGIKLLVEDLRSIQKRTRW